MKGEIIKKEGKYIIAYSEDLFDGIFTYYNYYNYQYPILNIDDYLKSPNITLPIINKKVNFEIIKNKNEEFAKIIF